MISKLISVLYCARVCVCLCLYSIFCRRIHPCFIFDVGNRNLASFSFCCWLFSPFSQLSLPLSYSIFPVVTMILLSRASLSFLWHLCQRNLLRAEEICSLRFWLSRPLFHLPPSIIKPAHFPLSSRLISVLSDTSNIYGCLQLENATVPLVQESRFS